MILTSSQNLATALATLYLLSKLAAAGYLHRYIHEKYRIDRLSSFVAAWVTVFLMQTAVILCLSASNMLTRPLFAIAMVSAGACLLYFTKNHTFQKSAFKLNVSIVACILIILILSGIWIRSIFLSDFTWDAQTYGIPRIAIWLKAQSVFVSMPTLQLNLFVNEWNGEFNAMAYTLISGNFLGLGFGNLEVLLAYFLVVSWVGYLLGASLPMAMMLAAVLGATPAIVGLAATVKGDLLAIVAFVAGFGWLLILKKQRTSIAITMLCLTLALAVGSKISVVVPSLMIVFAAILAMGKSGWRNVQAMTVFEKIFLVSGLLFASARFWSNWFDYGNPIRRVDVEKAQFSLSNISGNLAIAFERLFNFPAELQGSGRMWALAGSLGASAWLVALIVVLASIPIIRFLSAKNSHSGETVFSKSVWWMTAMILGLIGSTVFSMALSEPFLWTFRYFLPSVVVFLLVFGSISCALLPASINRWVIVPLCICTVLLNCTLILRNGEVLPGETFADVAMEVEMANTPIKRLMLLIKGPYDRAAVDILGLDSSRELSILMLKDLETSLTPFLGSHVQNKIQTVISVENLIVEAEKNAWDLIVVAQKKELRQSAISAKLQDRNYLILVDNEEYIIGIALSQIELVPIKEMSEITWETWNPELGVTLSIDGGMPSIQSDALVDTGFISTQMSVSGPLLISASFEGAIAGTGSHAAHFSILGKQTVITLPPGKYDSMQKFQGLTPVLSANEPIRIAFGLGGWAIGKGHIKLTRLEAYRIIFHKDDQ